MRRGFPTVLLTTPNVLLPKDVFGGPNCGWLNKLKNSPRNSTFIRSEGPKVVLLKTAQFQLFTPSCRRWGSTRPSLPKPYAGGAEKQDVLNHPASRCSRSPATDPSHPAVTLGLRVPMPSPKAESGVPPLVLNFRGKPVWKYVVPSIPQPDTSLPATPLALLRYLCPFPNGK